MKSPRDDAQYYLIDIYMRVDGRVEYATQTQWVGWEDMGKRWERRRGRLVNPNLAALAGEPYLVVEGDEQLSVFLAIGGRALVEQATAEEFLPEIIGEAVAIPDGAAGFKDPGLVPDEAFKRAPSRKLRMAVLKRDRYRCRVCGRSPDDSTDIQLRVHHVRPWGLGGLTEQKNLLTLCHTCHDGLDPHFDPELFRFVDPVLREGQDEPYRAAVLRYRDNVSMVFAGERGGAS